jgi:feruloyl esterase
MGLERMGMPKRRAAGPWHSPEIIIGIAAFAAALSAADVALADQPACSNLNGALISPTAFDLPTPYGGQVSLATYVPATDVAPAFCKVVGQVNPVDGHAHPILFEVNLPEVWNNKVVQLGGNGANGTLVTGLGGVPDQPSDMKTPLGRGFATAGTDAGHPGGATIYEFMMQKEEFANHASLAYKKTHDAAVNLATAYYKKKPSRYYYYGTSEGGREAMAMAQQFPKDFDGIVAGVPIIGYTGLYLSDYNQWLIMKDGGFPTAPKLAIMQKASDEACDRLDGLKDGVISRYGRTCDGRVDLSKYRCTDGTDSGPDCLSDKQILFFNTVHSAFKFDVPLVRGATSYPGWFYGGEAQPQGYVGWRIPTAAPTQNDPAVGLNYVGLVRYGIMGDPKYGGPIPWASKAARIQEISALMDMTDPDLSPFVARGGKLIVKENGSDYAQSAAGGYAYRQAVIDTLGQPTVNNFMRFYVNPGVVHIGIGQQADGSAVPDKVDLLGALDSWVEGGPAPETLTVTSYTRAAPFTPLSSRPLCQYPLYPKYIKGDPKLAASFACTAGGDTADVAPKRKSARN